MYVIEKVTDKAQIVAKATSYPFGPGFLWEDAEKADELLIRGSSFSDPGPDFVEFVLLASGKEIASRRVAGY